MRFSSFRPALAVAALAVLPLMAGCFNPFNPRIPAAGQGALGSSQAAPVPTNATELLKLFAWCWNRRAYDEYSEIFSDDFQFQFGLADSAGNFYRDHGLYRTEELDTARHLFVEGTATEPPARSIILTLGSFIAYPDSRQGKIYPWHLEIRTGVTLAIDTGDQQYNITGSARFFVVRGDSARIPQEMKEKGFVPDRNRWYIERWEDETAGGSGGEVTAGPGGETMRLLRNFGPGGSAASPASAVPGSRPASPAAPASSTQLAPLDVTWGFLMRAYLAPGRL
jgi:hypothetical protein